MLVLSRGRNDKVVFPTLGITVEILRVLGNKVRLGIDAPKSIPIVRSEIADAAPRLESAEGEPTFEGQSMHSLRNRLHKATLGLRLLQRKLDTDQADDAEAIIFKVFNELNCLEDALTTRGAIPQPPRSSGRRALVVEDDANENELLAGYLRLSGFEVTSALDGLQAMVHLSDKNRPDVMLLDMKMPRFDGVSTVAAIRQNPEYSCLKIFAVTGTNQSETAVEVGPAGVDRWFTKPVDPEQLVGAIQADLNSEAILA